MISFLVAKFAAWGLPEPVRKLAAWATLVVVALAILATAKAAYDAAVIEDHEAERAVESMETHNVSAEQRAIDAVVNIAAENEREAAIARAEASEAAAALPATTKALNCARMRQAYPSADLAKMPAYQENCR